MPSSYVDSFGSAFSLIVVSEIGDKTFFIASLLAMQNPHKIIDVFLGATTALIIMTILSTMIGTVALSLLSPKVTTLLSSIGLIYFAINLGISLYLNQPAEEDEEEEVEKDLEAFKNASNPIPQSTSNPQTSNTTTTTITTPMPDETYTNKPDRLEGSSLLSRSGDSSDSDNSLDEHDEQHRTSPVKQLQRSTVAKETGKGRGVDWSLVWSDFNAFKTQFILYLTSQFTLFSPLFIQCCVLTFIAEWGDRSQIATILLASAKSPVLVTIGCVLGHMICTSLAIFFGKILSTQLNDRHLQTVAAVLFMMFGIVGLWNVFTGGLEELPQY